MTMTTSQFSVPCAEHSVLRSRCAQPGAGLPLQHAVVQSLDFRQDILGLGLDFQLREFTIGKEDYAPTCLDKGRTPSCCSRPR